MDWNWDKLPEHEHAGFSAHVAANRWGEVAKLCERYDISLHCCCNPQGLQAWAEWAIETGIINDGDTTGERMAKNASRDGGATV